jgi:hypothetical protein
MVPDPIFMLRGIFVVLLVFASTGPCSAEEIEPRRWSHLPVNTNYYGAGYGFTRGDIALDPVLQIEDGKMRVNTWLAKYIRTFELLQKSARIDLVQGYQEGRWTGRLEGAERKVKRSGFTDTILRFAVNLYGAPPLDGEEFLSYRAATRAETIVGAGLSVQFPSGEYFDDKLINLGTNRFTFRPQVGMVRTQGNWSLEFTTFVALHTGNDDFFGGNTLEQDPLYVVHGHLIRTFRPGVWTGVSLGHEYGSESTVDGEKKDDRKQNIIWVANFGFPLTRRLSFKASYIGSRTQESTGNDTDSFAVGLSTSW